MEHTVIDSYMPKYIQIQNFVLGKIADGDFKVGEQIPSECELAKSFEVSRITANAAIKELATKGVVERVRGKGTFVLPPQQREDNDSNPMVFFGGIKVNPRDPSGRKEHTLLMHGVMEPDAALRRKLSLPEGERVYRIVRRASAHDQLGDLDYSYIPMSVFGSHKLLQNEIENGCMHDYMREYLGGKPHYVRIFINTQAPPDADLSLLEAKNADRLFIWDTYVYEGARAIAITVTVSIPQRNKPFITLEL